MTPSANPSELWQRYCKYIRHYPQIGVTLDISRIRFPETFLPEMTGAVATAIKEMRELEQGAIANADEERMVGHYWLRTPSLAPTPEIKNEIEKTGREIKAFAQAVRSGEIRSGTGKEFRTVLVIGIGGSALGPQLIYDALGVVDDTIKVSFCDNTDPDGIIRLLQTLEGTLGETLVLVISKSGGTPETRNGALELAHAFKNCGLNFAKNAVAITSAGSKLDTLATEEGWLARFPMWDWVGGRTSLFSSVGLVPAALHGADLDAFISGASAMDEVTRNAELLENPAALLALSWFYEGDGKGKKDMVILPYKDRLMLMSKYLQQLVMESLGKERDRDDKVVNQGIAVYGNKGSTDQHAYVQQLREGVSNFFATFIEVLRDSSDAAALRTLAQVEPNTTSGDYLNGFFLGTRTALYENGRDSITISLDELSAKTVGALIALYERAVGFYASFVNINAYHQPGVEAGKKAAAQVLNLQKKAVAELKQSASDKRGITAADLAKLIGATDDVETVYKILSHLAANTGRGVVAEGDIAPERRMFRAA